MKKNEVMANKIEIMREGGKILGRILRELSEYVQIGMNELEIDKWVEAKILEYGAEVAYFEPETDFPGSICISVNDELIHGVPEDNILQDGDVVSFDLSIKYKDYYVDSAFTMALGKMRLAVRHLLNATEAALYAGIEKVAAGVKLGDVGYAIEKVLEGAKLGVIKTYVGHGIGEKIHLPPEVPNYGKPGTGYELQAGDVICIEPMTSLGKPITQVGDDEWTVFLKDGSLGAHFEHTVLVLEDSCEILTK